MLVSINKLKEFFSIDHLMELFRVSAILERIRNFRFFLEGTEIEIIKENDVFWFTREIRSGIWVKTILNEVTVKVVKILQADYFHLIGVKPKVTFKATSTEGDVKSSHIATKSAFTVMVGLIVGWRAYMYAKK